MKEFYKKKYVAQKCFAILMTVFIAVIYAFLVVDCVKKGEFGGRFWGGTLCLIFMLVVAIGFLSKDYLYNIREFCEKYGCSMEQLEEEFEHAETLAPRLRRSEHYIYFLNMMGMSDIADMRMVDHMQYEVESAGRKSQGYAHIFNQDGTDKEIPCNRKMYEKLEMGMK